MQFTFPILFHRTNQRY